MKGNEEFHLKSDLSIGDRVVIDTSKITEWNEFETLRGDLGSGPIYIVEDVKSAERVDDETPRNQCRVYPITPQVRVQGSRSYISEAWLIKI